MSSGSDETKKTVLGKAFLILDAFSRDRSSLSLAELAQRTGLPKSTVHRVSATLVEWGLLEKIGSDFCLGMRLFELGTLVPRWRTLRAAALPFMEDLFQATQETVNLAALDGVDIIYIEKLHGHRRSVNASRVGGHMPAHATALGKALLAFSPQAVVEAALERGLEPLTRYTTLSPAVFREDLDKVRDTGVAFEREEAELGFQCVAAPVFAPGRQVVAAISITVPTFTSLDGLTHAVRTAASGIQRVLVSGAPVDLRA